MANRTYNLFNSAAAANAVANFDVIDDCEVVEIEFSAQGLAGAAIDRREIWEVSTAPTAQYATNNQPNSSLLAILPMAYPVASAAAQNYCLCPGAGKKLKRGERVYLHGAGAGTAVAGNSIIAMVKVREA